MEIKNNELLRQFETKIDSVKVAVEYTIQDKKMFLTKLNTNGVEDEEKIGALITHSIEFAENKKLRVVPVHAPIVSFFKKNPKYKEVLAAGIKI